MQPANKRRAVKVRQQLRRGAYVIPSLFTSGSIVLGFIAIVRGLAGDFHTAALLVIIAGVLDTLDGWSARVAGTESEFGREYDSLADVLTFGSAPAILVYLWGLKDLGRIGWLVPIFFLLCAAIRLARYNVQTKVVDNRHFVGLPTPAAAGSLVSLLFLISEETAQAAVPQWLQIAMLITMGAVGSLMVSTFRYPSLKKLDLKRRVSYRAASLLAVGILVLAFRPAIFLVAAAAVYILSGPWSWLTVRGRLRKEEVAPAETLETS